MLRKNLSLQLVRSKPFKGSHHDHASYFGFLAQFWVRDAHRTERSGFWVAGLKSYGFWQETGLRNVNLRASGTGRAVANRLFERC
jgi:hypothetical protein